jgi:hypothetical protein
VADVKFDTKVDFDGKKVRKVLRNAKKEILWRQGQAIIAQAQISKLVPLETGTLRRSAVVTLETLPDMNDVFGKAKTEAGQGSPVVVDSPNEHTGNVDTAYVSYNTPYAAALHENTNWKPRGWVSRHPEKKGYSGHKKVKGPGEIRGEGGPKWLEKAVAIVRGKLEEIAKNMMEKFFNGAP